jgi:putative zinc finger/helix-turn-helix YgiT family protein
MKGLCPNCETARDLSTVDGSEDIAVRGEKYSVPVHYLKCQSCGAEFNDPASPHDALDVAYREYRKAHGLLQPEEIRDFRKALDLSQRELADLLGWGGATLSRYENGALQDAAHDRQLRLAMEPAGLLHLVERDSHALPEATSRRLKEHLRLEAREGGGSLRAFLEQRIGDRAPEEFNGYRTLDLDKLFNAVLFFAAGAGVVKTKLNKLLFYADFKFFKDYGTSITGARYAHATYGPVPDQFDILYTVLRDQGSLEMEEQPFGEYVAEFLTARTPVAPTVFSASELRVLATVKERFQRLSATAMTKQSHDEVGYQKTQDGQPISYEYARELGW